MNCSKCTNDGFVTIKGVRQCALCGFPVSDKRYLGDGVYYTFDGFGVMLTTENGIATTNSIYLEREVVAKLLQRFAANFDKRKLKAVIDEAG